MSTYFEAPDGENEPTIWLTDGDKPRAILRRCDIAADERADAWPVLVAGMCDEVNARTYGQCTACGALEVRLNHVDYTRDLSAMGEHHAYPFGYGCELCA